MKYLAILFLFACAPIEDSPGRGEIPKDSETGSVETTVYPTSTSGDEPQGTSSSSESSGDASSGSESSTGMPIERDRLVFVTSKSVQGDFGSKPGLDDFCNQAASKAGLLIDLKKRFKPWVSTHTEDARDRFYHSPGRYVLVDGTTIANNWDDLVDGTLQHPINLDEFGELTNATVFTDTKPDGTAQPNSNHCNDWTNKDMGPEEVLLGSTNDMDGSWTYLQVERDNWQAWSWCVEANSLYCIEYY